MNNTTDDFLANSGLHSANGDTVGLDVLHYHAIVCVTLPVTAVYTPGIYSRVPGKCCMLFAFAAVAERVAVLLTSSVTFRNIKRNSTAALLLWWVPRHSNNARQA